MGLIARKRRVDDKLALGVGEDRVDEGDGLKAVLLLVALKEVQQALCNSVERVAAQLAVPPDRSRERREGFEREDKDADEVCVFLQKCLFLQQ